MHPALAPYTFARGGITVRNRTVLAAMTNKQSHDDGTVSSDEIAWLEGRSIGGFGIITTAATHVLEHGQGWEGEFGTWSDHHTEGLTAMAEAITRHGAIGLAQLFHGGMRATEALTGVQPMSASANELGGDLGTSRAMSEQDIREVIGGFGAAARRCEQAGFQGVELHGAHGYLIAQFLGAGTNRRNDGWGGSQQKRTQLLAEIVSEVRRQTGPDFLVGVRLSPELKACGMNLVDSLETLRLCSTMELDFVHVSCWDIQATGVHEGREVHYTTVFRENLPDHLPLFTTGGVWNAEEAELGVEQGGDFIGVGRAGIGHPDWPQYLQEDGSEPLRPPFSVNHLASAGLSPTFIDYMRRWDGFVED
jgi:2,4-dienoyl-CoA reductase-like NADH-dependent reductase (Old Yellow Enzyme family)